jgi:hypothetical protein
VSDDLAVRRAANERKSMLLRAYKSEVTDWCHFELAIELACEKTGASDAEMRSIACDPGVWT